MIRTKARNIFRYELCHRSIKMPTWIFRPGNAVAIRARWQGVYDSLAEPDLSQNVAHDTDRTTELSLQVLTAKASAQVKAREITGAKFKAVGASFVSLVRCKELSAP